MKKITEKVDSENSIPKIMYLEMSQCRSDILSNINKYVQPNVSYLVELFGNQNNITFNCFLHIFICIERKSSDTNRTLS